MYLKNTASQKLEVFAFDYTTGAPKTGDAANITAYVNIDEAGYGTLTDTSATEVDSTNKKGLYLFDLTQGETNGTKLGFFAKSSTANVSVVCRPAVSFTQPATGILAPATAGRTLVVDGSGLADANMVKMGPTGSGTAQTARDIGASVLLSSGSGTGQLDFTSGVVKANATQFAGQTITCSGGVTIPAATLASTTNITAGTITTVTTVTNQLTAAAIATGIWQDTTAGDFTAANSIGKSIMNGVSLGTGLTIAAVSGAVGSVTGNVGGNVTGSVGSIAAGGIVTASYGTCDFTSTMKTSLGTAVGTAQTGDSYAYLAAANAVSTGVDFKKAMRRAAASTAGKVTGAGSGTELFYDGDGSTLCFTVTVDASGNRTVVYA